MRARSETLGHQAHEISEFAHFVSKSTLLGEEQKSQNRHPDVVLHIEIQVEFPAFLLESSRRAGRHRTEHWDPFPIDKK